MMPVPTDNFRDLLHRADRLLDSVSRDPQDRSLLNQTQLASSGNKSLHQVFNQGEQLWKSMVGFDSSMIDEKPDVKPGRSLLWSEASTARPSSSVGFKFPDKLRNAVEDISMCSSQTKNDNIQQQRHQEDVTDLEQFLRNERESMLLSLIEETFKKTSKKVEDRAMELIRKEWDDQKKRLIPTVPPIDLPDVKPNIYMPTAGLAPKTTMSELEVRFSESVAEYVEKSIAGGIPIKMIELFSKTADSLKKDKLSEIWQQVRHVLDVPVPFGKNAEQIRQSQEFKISSTYVSLKILETQFLRHMRTIVCGNLEQGQLGGVPGILNLIKAYLNIKLPSGYQGCEDGFLNGHPIWATIYYCLRVGDFQAACSVCCGQEAEAIAEFGNSLKHLMKPNVYRLSGEAETKLNLLWRTLGRASQDPFKKACFCAIFLCDVQTDHNDVAPNFEDWLWMKLRFALITEAYIEANASVQQNLLKTPSLNVSKIGGTSTIMDAKTKLPLERLRSQIVLEYGEKHFASGDSPLLYWTALWLTGQFEAAIEFLYRQQQHSSASAYRCHALHIALAMHEAGLLLTPEDADSKLISFKSGDSPIDYRLNLSRIITLYVAQFLSTDLRDALNYLYFLRNFKSSEHENLFYTAVDDLITDTKQYELLFGRLNDRGIRMPGLIDNARYKIDTDALIRYVAFSAEKRGSFEAAVTLFDLINDHSKVLKLFNDSLCQTASQPTLPGSVKERQVALATNIATRYRDIGYKADESIAAAFFQLMDIVTFFDLFHNGDLNNALEVIRRIKLIPLVMEDVDQFVKEFYMLPDEIRRILPELLTAIMCILSNQYKNIRGTDRSFTFNSSSMDEATQSIRASAKSIVQYAARIPFRMPGDTAARLVQMETFMY